MDPKTAAVLLAALLGFALFRMRTAGPSFDARKPRDSDPYPGEMSAAAINHMRGGEGYVDRLYHDALGHCHIGIGHLVNLGSCTAASGTAEFRSGGLPPGGPNTRAPASAITRERAEQIYMADVRRHSDPIVVYLGNVKVTQNQFDALSSASFNVGPRRVRDYIINPYLKRGDFAGAAQAFTVFGRMGYYPPGHERHLAGLNRRREYERDLFLA